MAPVRNAILEALTRQPVVIHSMVGENGEVGGNPAVDILLKDFSIDLAGVTLVENCTLNLSWGRRYGAAPRTWGRGGVRGGGLAMPDRAGGGGRFFLARSPRPQRQRQVDLS